MKRSIRLCLAAVAALMIGFAPVPAAAGGGCHSPDPTEGNGQTVRMSRNCMSPTVLNAEEGEVSFINDDPVLHNVTGSGLFEELGPGQSHSRRFGAGTYPFSCTLHPGMNGVLVVGNGRNEELAAGAPIAASPVAAASAAEPADQSVGALFTVAAAIVVALIAAAGGFAVGSRRGS